eukprot:scaffold154100_cov19-Tisochrysis_lutea.AAC.2
MAGGLSRGTCTAMPPPSCSVEHSEMVLRSSVIRPPRTDAPPPPRCARLRAIVDATTRATPVAAPNRMAPPSSDAQQSVTLELSSSSDAPSTAMPPPDSAEHPATRERLRRARASEFISIAPPEVPAVQLSRRVVSSVAWAPSAM